MAENVRAVLPQLDQKHSKQHGGEIAAVAEHDVHLERGLLSVPVVGKVRYFRTHEPPWSLTITTGLHALRSIDCAVHGVQLVSLFTPALAATSVSREDDCRKGHH